MEENRDRAPAVFAGVPADICYSGRPMTSSTTSPLHAVIGIICLGSLWGLMMSLAKLATSAGVPPISYSLWQSTGAGLLLLALAAWRGLKLGYGWEHIRFYLAMGIFSIALPNANMALCVAHMPAGLMSLLVNLSPVVTYALAVLIRLEAFSALRALGILIGLSGVVVLMSPGVALPDPEQLPWLLQALLTPALYGLGNIIGVKLRPTDSNAPILMAAGMLGGAISFLLPAATALDQLYVPWPPLLPGEYALIAVMFVSVCSYILYFDLLRRVGAVFVSQASYAVALSGLFWGWLFFGETVGMGVVASAALIFTGLYLVNRRPA
ncbi:MAG: DMT family transporter [Alphaproteobacteria bacterium]|nr:DMT family transporter [Alphaproteobacteria bacterium]